MDKTFEELVNDYGLTYILEVNDLTDARTLELLWEYGHIDLDELMYPRIVNEK